MNEEEAQTVRKVIRKKRVEQKIGLRQAYRNLFLHDDGKLKADAAIVLRSLSKFCYASKSAAKVSPKSGMIDPFATHIADGRREVFLFILNQVNVDDAVFNRLITQYFDIEET